MDIIALVKNHDHVCCRYRLAAYRPFFEDAGHHLELRSFAETFSWGWRNQGNLGKADVVILQRKLLSPRQLHRLRKQTRQLIFDFDDAVFLRDSYAPGGLHDSRLLQRFARTVQAADLVIAGNAFLAEQAALWTAPAKIHIIPTCVDSSRYQLRGSGGSPELLKKQASRLHHGPLQLEKQATRLHHGLPLTKCRLVWIGSSSTLRGMTHIRPMLELLGRQVPGLGLKIVCDRSLVLEQMPVQFCPWSSQSEAHDLAESDVGISWLPADDWSRGKCGLKILQYMAAGLPVVANPVGVQAELIQHGVTGFLAQTPEEWCQALARLAQSPELRQRMGARGREIAESCYEVRRGADAWLKIFRSQRQKASNGKLSAVSEEPQTFLADH
jgi:glycosyltransferase involved in cell wall biosynthesis